MAVAIEEIPLPQTEDVQAEIQREAQRRHAERAELREIIAQQPEIERRKQLIERRKQLQERIERERVARVQIENERASFHAQLRKLVRLPDMKGGSAIWTLCKQHYAEPSSAIEESVAEALRGRAARWSSFRRIALFRSHGVPEPVILEHLAREHMSNIVARRGPDNEYEAIVWAARQLLAVPLPSEKHTTPSPSRATARAFP